MKKILLSSAITMLLTVSTMAQADNSSVSGVAVDSLGLPSSALLLTDTESDNTRGSYWREYKAAKAEFRAAECNQPVNSSSSDECLDLYFTADGWYGKWQGMKKNSIADPDDYSLYNLRARSY